MPIDTRKLFDSPAFTSLGAERLRLVKQFAVDIENKKGPEIAALYMRLNQSLTKIKPLSQAERAAVTEAIHASLPEADRSKFEQILKMVSKIS